MSSDYSTDISNVCVWNIGIWNVPEILATHAVQYEIDAKIGNKKLLGNTLADHKIGWILDFVLMDGGEEINVFFNTTV